MTASANPTCVSRMCPECVPTDPQGNGGSCVSHRPLSYGGDTLGQPSTSESPSVSRDPGLDLLLQAAKVARITGDAPGALAILIGCSPPPETLIQRARRELGLKDGAR